MRVIGSCLNGNLGKGGGSRGEMVCGGDEGGGGG